MALNINKGFKHIYCTDGNVRTITAYYYDDKEMWYRTVPRTIFQDMTRRACFIRLARRS
nr:hypothetical protein [uncultured Bacteroides sp.]